MVQSIGSKRRSNNVKASHELKLKALALKPQIVFKGIQKGLDLGEMYPLYNVISKQHDLNDSTITISTIKSLGIKDIKL